MELTWIEDFIELSATRNFSAAAATRNVTQPAFSRRIRALENWMGAELIDRGTYPVKLTQAGETFLEASRDLANTMHRLRDECRRQQAAGSDTISVSALHSIALSIFPSLYEKLLGQGQAFRFQMQATDFHDCIEALSLGRSNIAFTYSHPSGPPVLATDQFSSICLMQDPFLLVKRVDSSDKELIKASIPLVSFTADCYLGKLQAFLLKEAQKKSWTFHTVFENSMSEAIKRMVLSGAGVAWLPESTIAQELESGLLVPVEGGAPQLRLNVMAFRKKALADTTIEKFWKQLESIK